MTSAIFTQGYQVITDSLAQLEQYLAERAQQAGDLIGLAADRLQSYQEQPDRPQIWRHFMPPIDPGPDR